MRHRWEGDASERTCTRCGLVCRTYVGQGGYRLHRDGASGRQNMVVRTLPPCDDPYWGKPAELVPEAERFRPYDSVVIIYPKPVLWITRRRAFVVEDNGGPKVQVSWKADDKAIPGRRYVAYYGATHVQWIPRERLEKIS